MKQHKCSKIGRLLIMHEKCLKKTSENWSNIYYFQATKAVRVLVLLDQHIYGFNRCVARPVYIRYSNLCAARPVYIRYSNPCVARSVYIRYSNPCVARSVYIRVWESFKPNKMSRKLEKYLRWNMKFIHSFIHLFIHSLSKLLIR